MAASANLARLHGERIGHLSRYDSTDLLREELAAVAGLLQQAPVKFAFRKAFFGAGGKEEHWEKYASPLLETTASAAPLPAPVQDAASLSDDVPAGEPVLSEPEAPPTAEDALQVPTTDAQMVDDPETPEEDLPWDQLTAELAEAEETAEVNAGEQTTAGEMAETSLSDECSLDVSQMADRGIAVKVKGSFGAGEYGGSRFLEEVTNAVQAGAAGVLLDLSRLSALRPDCSAPILACQIKLQSVGGRLAVVQPPDDTFAILDATGLTERVECFADEADAVAYLQPVCENTPVT
ncbi:MAG: hypothetical protein ACE5JM_03905 [Armatimonadota bacterium]